jgi:hypothetical protein
MAKIRVPQVRGGYRYTTFVCKDKLSQVRGKIYNICIAKLRVSQIRGEGRENNICNPPLTCGTLILAIKMWYIFPFTCGNLTLAIHMLYILLLTVAF